MERFIVHEEHKVFGVISNETHSFNTKKDASCYIDSVKAYLNENGSYYANYKESDEFFVDDYPNEFMVSDGELTADNYEHIWLETINADYAMKYTIELNNLRERLQAGFRELVKERGEQTKSGWVILTYEFCTETGMMLDCSTVDCIRLCDEDLMFIYNANVIDDYDIYEEFDIYELAKFYDALVEWLDNNDK